MGRSSRARNRGSGPSRNAAGAQDRADEACKTLSPRFLVVGQDSQMSEAIRSVFEAQDNVRRAASPQEALQLLTEQGTDVLLLPQRMFHADQYASSPHGLQGADAPAALDLDAVRIVGELLKALSRATAKSSVGPES